MYKRQLLDSQDSEFSEIYTSYWQEKELEEAGVAASKVQEILNQGSISTMKILGKDGASNYWYTYILVFVLYFLVIFYGQMIATSITSEKSNRAIEVLVTTVDSTSLIFGKVIAGAISGIFQAGVIDVYKRQMSFLGRQKYAAGQPADIHGAIVQAGLFRGADQAFLNYISILSAGVCQADNKTFRAKEKWICRLTVRQKRGKMRVSKKQLSDRCLLYTSIRWYRSIL